MKSGKCDICHKECDPSSLSNLHECYQTTQVKEVCSECVKWSNNQLSEVRKVQFDIINKEMRERITRKSGEIVLEKKLPWWKKGVNWSIPNDPAPGTIRTIKKFLWMPTGAFPKGCDTIEVRWLCFAKMEQIFICGYFGPRWLTSNWVDNEG